jgi:hypothetical protein
MQGSRYDESELCKLLLEISLLDSAYQRSTASRDDVPIDAAKPWMLWIHQSVPAQSRWYPVLQRYIAQIIGRVTGFGGNPGPRLCRRLPGPCRNRRIPSQGSAKPLVKNSPERSMASSMTGSAISKASLFSQNVARSTASADVNIRSNG